MIQLPKRQPAIQIHCNQQLVICPVSRHGLFLMIGGDSWAWQESVRNTAMPIDGLLDLPCAIRQSVHNIVRRIAQDRPTMTRQQVVASLIPLHVGRRCMERIAVTFDIDPSALRKDSEIQAEILIIHHQPVLSFSFNTLAFERRPHPFLDRAFQK